MSAYAFVLAWIAHATLLGVVALWLPRLSRMRDVSALVHWWRVTSLLVVLMPLLPLLLPAAPRAPTPLMAFAGTATVAFGGAAGAEPGLSPSAWLACVWAVGALARLAWVVAGMQRLRGLAGRGAPVMDPALDRARALAPAAVLPQLAATRVPVLASAAAMPCAFGCLQPRVLVPTTLADRPEDERTSVYLHELAHVARFDLGHAYADECLRIAFWWQPAMWWLLAQQRLAREHQVDALVVARTAARRAYVEALLWCSTLRTAALPATQIWGGQHALVQRVRWMSTGGTMTQTRRLAAATAMILMFGGVTGMLATLSPLRAVAAVQDSGAKLVGAGPLERIAVKPTLDAPAPRRVTAVEPEWREANGYRFRVHMVIDAVGRVAESRIVGRLADERSPGPAEIAAAEAAVLDAVNQWQFDTPVQAPMLIAADVDAGAVPARPVSLTATRAPLRVGGGVQPPQKIVDVPPVYPAVAREARVAGVVIIEATVGVDGAVIDTRVLRSIPLLDQAAVTAVKQWRYTPTWLNGEAVPVQMVLTVNFTLQ